MERFEGTFDNETVEHISNLVESKMHILREIEEFKKIDKKLSIFMEELENALPENLKDKFDEIIKLTYQTEEYYFTLAYSLGIKYGSNLNKI